MPKRPKKSARKNKRTQKKSVWKRLIKLGVILGIWSVLIVGGILLWFAYDLPSIDDLESGIRRPSIVFLTKSHEEIAHSGDLYGEAITVDSIPPYVIQAIISTEDSHFYEHHGIDWTGILRAALANLRAGGIVQGGSTLTQQIAKNVFLSPDRSFRRKMQEMLFSFWLEFHFTKKQLLNIYLNRVYLGTGTYGIDAASQEYFGSPISRISLAEATVLASLLKAPSRLAPSKNPKKAKQRAHFVAKRMFEEGHLTKAELGALKRDIQELTFQKTSQNHQARYFTDWIMKQLPALVDLHQDLIVVTTLDLPLQKSAETAIDEILATAAAKDNAHQAAFLALDYDGAVRAMIGGHDYLQTMFNRATQAKRQMGSTFKFFVYLAALQQGFPATRLFNDASPNYKGWSPKNYGWRSRGDISMEDGFVYSVNTVAVRVAEAAGLKNIIQLTKTLGLREKMPYDLSVSLGSGSCSLIELTNAYTMVANGGYETAPYGILQVLDSTGKQLYHHNEANSERVIQADIAQEMQRFLFEATRRGTGKRANIPGVTLGGKTGTSQKHRDAWFVGITSDLVAGVWVGNDDESPMKRVTGALYPIQIWRRVMNAAAK